MALPLKKEIIYAIPLALSFQPSKPYTLPLLSILLKFGPIVVPTGTTRFLRVENTP